MFLYFVRIIFLYSFLLQNLSFMVGFLVYYSVYPYTDVRRLGVSSPYTFYKATSSLSATGHKRKS